jgi:hypothetical protein
LIAVVSDVIFVLCLCGVQVKEDYPLSEPIFVAQAHDQDRGANAEISYGLDTMSQLAVGHTFKVHRSSGEVRGAVERYYYDIVCETNVQIC